MELPVIGNAAPAAGGGCASSGCGSAPDALGHLPEHIRAKVQDTLRLAVNPERLHFFDAKTEAAI